MMAAIHSFDDCIMLLTRESKGPMGKVHHRMPVLLDEKYIDEWLDCENVNYEIILSKLIRETDYIFEDIETKRIGGAVNNVREKSDKCLMSIEE